MPRRIWAMLYRHFALYRRSWPRLLEIAYWPTLNLLIWGFTATYISHLRLGPVSASAALIFGVLLWEVALRGQMSVTISFLEEVWSRNLGHIFISPLRPSELVVSLLAVSIVRTIIGLLPATIIAYALYQENIFTLGPALLLFFVNLMVMGWWIALGVVALLFRYGAGAEALAWTIAFGITPIACVYYPVTSLPLWLQPVAQALPASHIFAGMRAALFTHAFDAPDLLYGTLLNVIWMAAGLLVFAGQFRAARSRGALISMGE